MGKLIGFTPEELEELRRFDAEVDASELTYEDYLLEDLVEDLLFPERVVVREKNKERYKREVARKPKDQLAAEYKADYARRDKEHERARKHDWYLRNKARIQAKQKDYRIRTGRQKADAVPAMV